MERFKRKLTLLDIPVYEIAHEQEILPIVKQVAVQKGLDGNDFARLHKITAENLSTSTHASMRGILPVSEAFLAVEESVVFFLENRVFEYINGNLIFPIFSLLIHEKNIVECVEVALFKINNGSLFYGKELGAIRPEVLSDNCIFFIYKDLKT